MALQSAVLGLGAYLVVQGEATAGVIIAGSILSARALAPMEQVIAHWKGFSSARQSWTRLRELFSAFPEPADYCPCASRRNAYGRRRGFGPSGDQRFVVTASPLR